MAANARYQRVWPLPPRPSLLALQEIATNRHYAPRFVPRTSTATQRETMGSGDRRRRHRATSSMRLLRRVVILLLAGALRAAAAEEAVDIRPVWMPLEGLGDAEASSVPEVFRSSEVLQMYHLQATEQLYEQGGLNHDMSFFLTAVAFYSLERPDVKISLAYHPTNMTISLLPVISEDGRGLRWDHQSASTSYVMAVDQSYWTAGSYMGETTGAFFSYAVEFSLDYHVRNPRYQPFSVYEDYPGREFLTASSCDEYVWALLSAAQTRGVRLKPALLPQKHKIVIYSHSEPEIIALNSDGGDGEFSDPSGEGKDSDGGGGGSGASSNSNGPASMSPDSWSSSSLSSSANKPVVGEGGGQAGKEGKNEEEEGEEEEEEEEEEDGGGGGGATNSTDSSSASSGVQEGQGEEEEPGGDGRRWRGRRQRRRTLVWGLSLRGLVDEVEVDAMPAPGSASTVSSGEDFVSIEPASDASDASDGNGEAREVEPVVAEGVATLQPAVSTVSSMDMSVAEAALGQTPAPAAVLDDWQQVVAYYQSLQLCLQERKFSFVTSLKDFARYFDCLDDVAFISIGPHEYYKVNLTSTKLDHISLPEDLPEVPQRYEGFTWVDTVIATWILMIMACGIHGILWQAAVIQHWLKCHGYGEQMTEEALANGEDEPPRLERHPSLTRQITTEYLRLGHLLLGKTDDEYQISPPYPRSAGSAAPAAVGGGLAHPGDEAEATKHFDGTNETRPPQQPSPNRGAHSNGGTKVVGGEQREGPGRGNPYRGRRLPTREEEEGGLEMRETTKMGATRKKGGEGEGEGDTGPSLESASGVIPGGVEKRNARSPPLPSISPPRQRTHGAGGRSRARVRYRTGVDDVEDRWIGFAGSPRGERSAFQGPRQLGDGDRVGEELVGSGVEYYAAEAGGGSSGNRNRHQDSGKEAGVDFVAAPQGEAWAAQESEADLEEGLEEMLSGTSR